MPQAPKRTAPPVVVIFGDEEFQKTTALHRILDGLLPPEVDRSMALCEYDGTRGDDAGGPSLAAVMDDLATLPFLSDRRVVVVRDAEKFISAYREKLENYLKSPAPTGTLVLLCRSFPKTTRLYKAANAAGGSVIECRKLYGKALVDFVISEATARRKRIDYAVAARLVELVGQEQGFLAGEVEKLSLFVGERPSITAADVSDLVGLTREEKIFAVMDAAAAGRLAPALQLWNQVIATDPAAIYKSLGGIAFKVRNWLNAQQLVAHGTPIRSVAPRVMMRGRERELEALLRRLSPVRLRRILGSIATLDSQAKVGARSIETGIEALLTEVAAP